MCYAEKNFNLELQMYSDMFLVQNAVSKPLLTVVPVLEKVLVKYTTPDARRNIKECMEKLQVLLIVGTVCKCHPIRWKALVNAFIFM